MRHHLIIGTVLAVCLFAAALPCFASEDGGHQGLDLGAVLPLWSIVPFVGILLSIALFPLLAPHFWHDHFPAVSAFWSLLLAVPFVAAYRMDAAASIYHIILLDFIPFLILISGLFTVAGGIVVRGSLRGSPLVNVILLVIGTILASWIGTTGASMVMIRPVLRANSWRKHQAHTVVFFIFLVSNIGGSLTPLGDPPLFLGFLHGVSFFWTLKNILFTTLFTAALVISVYFIVDSYFYKKEEKPADDGIREPVRVEGMINLVYLAGIVAAVLASGLLDLGTVNLGLGATQSWQNIVRDMTILAMGILSWQTTAPALREVNQFSWSPVREVAILFAGIFITIIPALAILRAGKEGALAGLVGAVNTPGRYFWASGGLSSFLDNAPTYLTFFNAAIGQLYPGMHEAQAVQHLMGHAGASAGEMGPRFLRAISAGSVFMGANSYIGNAPNFMVKAIAEEAGVPMPSFFGYMVRFSLPVLIPVFILVTWLFC